MNNKDNHYVAGQLNKLVEINNDRIQGYETAAKETKDGDLKSLFGRMESHSRNFKNELAAEVRKRGEEPTDGTRTDGKLYRAWMDVKAAVATNDRRAILGSCEFGEDAALETYNEVLKEELPAELSSMISRQKSELKSDHDLIRNMRDSTK